MSHTEHNGAARTHMLNGGGEMGARIRAFDWSQTPLGPIEHWPHSLCTALSICLNATMPLSIIWGQQLIQFYNDAYIPLAIGRHPSILGGAVPENWPDTWPTIKGWLDDVFAGQPAYIENVLLITRRDALDEECYFTMSFSPIHDERGAVGGVFHAMFETTSTILSERRLHTLRSLVVALTDTTSISEISEQTIRVLRDNPHDVPFALVYEIDDTAVRLCALTGAVPDAACIPEWLDLKSQAASAWPFLSAIHQPTPTLMRDLVAPTSESASGRAYNAIKSALALPITLPRAARPVALLVLGLHPQRVFDDSYRRFFEQIAEYLHAAVARVRAAEDERTRTHARAEIERVKATFVSAKSYVSPASLTLLFNPVDVTAQDTHIRELLLRDLDAERVRLEAILQHVPAAIMILRPNGTLIFGNDQVENVFNTAFPTSMSLTDYEWNMYDPVTGALLQPEQSPLARTIVQGETIIGEVVKILNNDGSERYLAVNTAPVRDAAGTLVYGVAAFMDITAHRRADDEARNVRRLLHISLEASNAGVWDMDMIHDRVTGDHMIARIFSLPVEDVIAGRVAPEVYLHAIHPDDRSLLIDAIANAIVRHESYEVDYRVPQANDGVIWVSVRGKPELDDTGRVVRLPGLMFDITARKRAEEALRLSEQRFRYMADHAPVMVWVTDVHASCTYLGKSWCEFTGQSLTAAQGFGWLDVVHADDRVHIQDIFMRANARHEPFQYEYRIRHRNGDYRWAIDTAMPYFSEDGAFLGHIGSVIDITERRHAEARDRFLFQLLDITRSLAEPQHIIAASAEMLGKHLEVDRCAYTEIDTDKQLLTILHDYTTPGMMSIVGTFTMATLGAEGLRLMREGQPYIVADVGHEASIVQHRAVYESIRIGAFIAVPLLKQECLVAGMTVHQRVPRHWKADEIEIVQLVTNLCWESIERARVTRNLRESEERLQALYAQEQAARQQAEEASRLKDEFLATVSHELRTPLTAILGYGQVLQYRQRDDVHTTHIVDKIVQSAMAQSQLIEDLLDVSQIVTGNLRLTPLIINLLPVIQTAIDNVRPALDAKALQLHIQFDGVASTILGDAHRLQQVVWNLLSNAVKFTPLGGAIAVQLRAIDEYVQLTIKDTGQGISADFLPYVFDRFRQADSTSTRSYGGLGLGLAIVRHVVEMHGGTVQAHSEGLGKGTLFTVLLPAVVCADAPYAPDGANATPWACPPELAGLRVLIVDDQSDVLELLYEILRPCGVVVKGCTMARDALATLRVWRPDVLLSDIALPTDDGYWLIQNVRSLAPHEGRDTPAIALTAYVRLEDRVRVLTAGFQRYLSKPVNPFELLNVIAGCAVLRGKS